jgi:hypothetical protein
MDQRCGSSSTVPTLQMSALQVQSPKFKFQWHLKKKNAFVKEMEINFLKSQPLLNMGLFNIL